MQPQGQESITILIDYRGTTLRTNPSISVAKKVTLLSDVYDHILKSSQVLTILQDHYVETLGRGIVVHLPTLLNFFYKGISPFLGAIIMSTAFPAVLNVPQTRLHAKRFASTLRTSRSSSPSPSCGRASEVTIRINSSQTPIGSSSSSECPSFRFFRSANPLKRHAGISLDGTRVVKRADNGDASEDEQSGSASSDGSSPIREDMPPPIWDGAVVDQAASGLLKLGLTDAPQNSGRLVTA
jgi:hypothetical protein